MAARVTGQTVHDELHGKIVRGTLRPGELLSETRVAESYGLSRTPVRAVFWRLAEEGLLRIIPQVGSFVAPISIKAAYDAQFIREGLECRAVAEAALAAQAEDVVQLRALFDQQRAAIAEADFTRFFALDEQMHRQLMLLAGHPFVWQVIASAKAQLDRVRFLSLEQGAWPAMILDQHDRLIDAVARHDGAGAVAVMTAHLRTAFAAIERIAADHPDFFDEPHITDTAPALRRA